MPNKEKETKLRDRKGNLTSFRVSISKSFEYPSFTVKDEDSEIHLFLRCLKDIKSMVESDSLQPSDLSFKIEKNIPYKLRRGVPSDNSDNTPLLGGYSLMDISRELAYDEVEDEYGVIDVEKNPDLFHIEESEDPEISDVVIYLKGDVEEALDDATMRYRSILKKRLKW